MRLPLEAQEALAEVLTRAGLVDHHGHVTESHHASFAPLDAARLQRLGRPGWGPLTDVAATHLAGARRRIAFTAFLGGARDPVKELSKTPKLGKIRLWLMYQTLEVYKTDVGKQKFNPKKGYKYACNFPAKDGLGPQALRHPSIVFNDKVRKIHVHMKDTDTGDIFWDADYTLPTSLVWGALGKSYLSNSLRPTNGAAGAFHLPCVPKDDPTTHHFDISIQTQDGYYNDNATPWGDMEGFKNFRGTKAHIGFDAKRLPELESPAVKGGLFGALKGLTSTMGDPKKPQREIVGKWKPGGSFSRGGPVHHDRFDRVNADEEDPFEDPDTGKSYHGYYFHIIDPRGRKRNNYEYLDKYSADSMYSQQGSDEVNNFLERVRA